MTMIEGCVVYFFRLGEIKHLSLLIACDLRKKNAATSASNWCSQDYRTHNKMTQFIDLVYVDYRQKNLTVYDITDS